MKPFGWACILYLLLWAPGCDSSDQDDRAGTDAIIGDSESETQSDSDKDSESDSACALGDEGCPCTPEIACDPGLLCISGVCAVPGGDGDADGDVDGDIDTDTDVDSDADSDVDADACGDRDGDYERDPAAMDADGMRAPDVDEIRVRR